MNLSCRSTASHLFIVLIFAFSQVALIWANGNGGAETILVDDNANSTSTRNVTRLATNNRDEGKQGKSEDKGAVAIAITITVLVLVAVVLAVFFIRRRRQTLMVDKEKKMQMLMTSARNAGVYQDPTVAIVTDEKPPASPEHEKLNAAQEA